MFAFMSTEHAALEDLLKRAQARAKEGALMSQPGNGPLNEDVLHDFLPASSDGLTSAGRLSTKRSARSSSASRSARHSCSSAIPPTSFRLLERCIAAPSVRSVRSSSAIGAGSTCAIRRRRASRQALHATFERLAVENPRLASAVLRALQVIADADRPRALLLIEAVSAIVANSPKRAPGSEAL